MILNMSLLCFYRLTSVTLLLLVPSLHIVCFTSAETYPICPSKRDSCSCMTDKGLIDLSPLDKPDQRPNFKDIRNTLSQSKDTYYYNPCTAFSGTVGSCLNVAICQQWPFPTPANGWSFGDQDSATFMNDPTTQKLQLRYGITGRTVYITLECEKSKEGELTFNKEEPINTEWFTLSSKYACPGGSGGGGGGGMSVGTVLCILFIVLVTVYLVGGVIYMHFAKGAQGVEKIPNSNFWKEFPGLVKDGVILVVSPARAAVFGYNQV